MSLSTQELLTGLLQLTQAAQRGLGPALPFHLLQINNELEIVVQTFTTRDELIEALKLAAGQGTITIPIEGTILQITKPPYRRLLHNGRQYPLYDEKSESEVDLRFGLQPVAAGGVENAEEEDPLLRDPVPTDDELDVEPLP